MISVIIPVYNGEKYLDECVETVHHMIQCEGWKMSRRQADVEELRRQISRFSKGE